MITKSVAEEDEDLAELDDLGRVDVAGGLQHDEDHLAVDLELRPLVGVDRVLDRERVQVELALRASRTPPRSARTGRSRRTAPGSWRAVVGVLELHLAVAPASVLVDRAVDDHASGLWRRRRASSTASLAVARLAGVRGLLAARPSSAAQLGPRLDAELARQLVAADRQPRAGPCARHSSAAGISSVGQLQVRVDRRARRCLPRVASRSAHDSSVTSTSTGAVRVEVAVDGAPVERALVHEEAEHEVVAGQPPRGSG